MDFILYGLGCIAATLIMVYSVIACLYRLSYTKAEHSEELEMPILRPLPIPTKAQKSRLNMLIAFVFEVRRWELVYAWRYVHRGQVLVVPAGFHFDGVSIPRPFWALLNPAGLLLLPGLIHDYGYRYQQIWSEQADGSVKPCWTGEDKRHWDRVFREMADEINGMVTVNFIARLAVILGGGRAWNKWRREGPPVPDFRWSLEQ